MLRVIDISKDFFLYRRPWHRLVELASAGYVPRAVPMRALAGVSFEVRRGGALGIVGGNGAGKSTLLKIVAGTLYATAGRVEAEGRVAALLDLGVGFHPDLTGRQNAILNGRLLGLSRGEMAARVDDVTAFAELEKVIDHPLRTYSTGMQLRLGFAVAVSVTPDILAIDDSLAVGDVRFQQKCLRRLADFRARGVTTVLVSHDAGSIERLCDEVLLLHHGRVIDRGPPARVLAHHRALADDAPGGSGSDADARAAEGAT